MDGIGKYDGRILSIDVFDVKRFTFEYIIFSYNLYENMESKEVVALVIGDPHFKTSNALETSSLMVESILTIARRIKPDFIVDLGDTLDRHETIHVSPLERATQFLSELSKIAPLYVIIGNHDRPNNSNFLTTEHPFNALKLWSNTTVVDKVVSITIKGLKFTMVPYVPPGKFEEALNTLPGCLEGVRTIFAHQEFKGAKMGAVRSEVGDSWSLSNPLVISGHIHDYDRLQPNIIYTGTPLQHAFGDREDKTVSIYRFPLMTSSTVDVNATFTEERIDLGLEKKTLVYLTCEEVMTYTPPPGKHIKIVVRGTSAEIKAIMKLPSIKQLVASGIKVVYKDLPSHAPERSPPRHDKMREALSYTRRLHDSVQQDEEMKALFTELFGTLDTRTISLNLH